MDRLLLEIDCFWYDGLEEYLLSLSGILEVSILNSMNVIVDVKYDSNMIALSVLKLEILFYLGILKIPSIISFDKYSKVPTDKYNIVMKDVCCEFCFRGMIEELFDINGIESITSDFNEYNHRENVIIEVHYNPKIISELEIKKLELQFNYSE